MALPLNPMNVPGAVQVIKANDDHSFTLDESALEKILLDRRVKNSKVIVLSIAGAFRKGKSFLLNFFIRYLKVSGWKWLDDPNIPLQGFEWKAGVDRNTNGILMWSEPFEVTLPGGEKAFVLLMDTQGAFDTQAIKNDCVTIFALSTIISSVQIYNVTSNIQEDDLQNLQLFAVYGQLVLEKSDSKPFQGLYFLVRDWPCDYEYAYGLEGGEGFLKKRLEITGDQHEELLKVRRHLHSCFEKIECCLLPHPGLKAATCKDFDGRLSDIDEKFKLHVEKFVETLMSPKNLIVKEINGMQITGKELFGHFKAYMKVFQSNELPPIASFFEATVEANNHTAVSKAMGHYKKRINLICGSHMPYVKPRILNRKHDRYKQEAVQQFRSNSKMGDEEKRRGFQVQLERRIEESFESYFNSNEDKPSCKKQCCCFLN